MQPRWRCGVNASHGRIERRGAGHVRAVPSHQPMRTRAGPWGHSQPPPADHSEDRCSTRRYSTPPTSRSRAAPQTRAACASRTRAASTATERRTSSIASPSQAVIWRVRCAARPGARCGAFRWCALRYATGRHSAHRTPALRTVTVRGATGGRDLLSGSVRRLPVRNVPGAVASVVKGRCGRFVPGQGLLFSWSRGAHPVRRTGDKGVYSMRRTRTDHALCVRPGVGAHRGADDVAHRCGAPVHRTQRPATARTNTWSKKPPPQSDPRGTARCVWPHSSTWGRRGTGRPRYRSRRSRVGPSSTSSAPTAIRPGQFPLAGSRSTPAHSP